MTELEYECWCSYNHEHINEFGEWVDDEDELEDEEWEDELT